MGCACRGVRVAQSTVDLHFCYMNSIGCTDTYFVLED
jgi:hypothetical protein